MAVLNPRQFTKRFYDQIAGDPQLNCQILDDLKLVVENRTDRRLNVYLDNAYSQYRQSPDQVDAILTMYIRVMYETLETAEDIPVQAEQIVPVIKDETGFQQHRESTRALGGAVEERICFEPLNGQLYVIYAVDTGKSLAYLPPSRINPSGLPMESIRKQAVDNLMTLLPELTIQGQDGIYLVSADGTYEASLLLFDHLWTPENFEIDGEIVVAIPSRDILIVTGSQAPENLLKMQLSSQEVCRKSSYALTNDMFIRKNDGWALFVPGPLYD